MFMGIYFKKNDLLYVLYLLSVACGGGGCKFKECPKKSEKIPKNAFYVFKNDKFFFGHEITFFVFFWIF